MVLENSNCVEFRQKPVLQIIEQYSRLCEDALVDTKIPWWRDVEEILGQGDSNQIKKNDGGRRKNKHPFPIAIENRTAVLPRCEYRHLNDTDQERQQDAVFF